MEDVRARLVEIQEAAGADRMAAVRQLSVLVATLEPRPLDYVYAASFLAEMVLRTTESDSAQRWLQRAAAALPPSPPAEILAGLRRAECVVALAQGERESALRLAYEACQLAQAGDDLRARAQCSQTLGMVLSTGGMVEEALDAAFDARRTLLSAGLEPSVPLENNIAINLMELEYYERARSLADRCVRRAAEHGQAGLQASALVTRGMAAFKAGLLAEAVDDHLAGLEIAGSVGNVQTLQVINVNLGLVYLARGDRVAAGVAWARARALLPDRPSRWIAAVITMEEAALADDGARAAAMLEEARDELDAIGRQGEALDAVRRLYALAKAEGRWQAALAQLEDCNQRHDALEQGRRRRRARVTELRVAQELADDASAPVPAELQEILRELEATGEGLRARNRELEVLATRDELTGLANRRAFDERLAADLRRVRRAPLSLAVVDVDRFKAVNDTFGHQIGDAVLRQVAAVLQADRRVADLVARRGGDEFVVLLPSAGVEAARSIAERMVEGARAADWAAIAPGLAVRLSVGVAEAVGSDPGEVLAAADAALYAAKQAGRDGVK